jgi:hypothetical protein
MFSMSKQQEKGNPKSRKGKRIALGIVGGFLFVLVLLVVWVSWGKNQGEVVGHTYFSLNEKLGDDPSAVSEETLAAEHASAVYMTTDISPEGLVRMYEVLGVNATGKVAVKLHTGEGAESNYLRPDFIEPLVTLLNGTIVECNTAYGGSRANTALHEQVVADRGFLDIAPVDIMDADGSMSIPVIGGSHLKEDLVGAHLANYDFVVVLSHFKGHAMGGFGGAIKNISIGIASSQGKGRIHSGGISDSFLFASMFTRQNAFLESMAEAAKAVSDYENNGETILYINILNNISVDCDCVANPTAPDMHDIGILASTDPVALDQACVDLIYQSGDGASVIERIESRNGLLTLQHAEEIGLGNRWYYLIPVD